MYVVYRKLIGLYSFYAGGAETANETTVKSQQDCQRSEPWSRKKILIDNFGVY